jgi:hypothetical protein
MWWAVSLVLLAIVGYLLYVVLQAWYETKDAPRVPMFLCPKHGAVPTKYTLKLNVFSDRPVEYCPFCMADKMKAAKAGK